MPNLLSRRIALVGIVVAVIVAAAGIATARRPVLVHAFGEGDCACGDFHEKVTGVVVWNPFRDRTPETAANH